MASRTVVVHMQLMHTETGLWCDTCALPSVVRVDAVLWAGTRPLLVSRAECQDCGEVVR